MVHRSRALKFPAPCRVRRFPGHWSRVPCKARRSREHWSRVHCKMRPFPVPLALYKSYPARYSFRPSQLCCCRIPYRNLRNLYYLQNRCRRCHSRSYHRKHQSCCPSFHLRRYLYCNPDFRPLSKCLYFPRNNRCHSYRCSPYSRHFRFRQPQSRYQSCFHCHRKPAPYTLPLSPRHKSHPARSPRRSQKYLPDFSDDPAPLPESLPRDSR